jgi:hypothetical protein
MSDPGKGNGKALEGEPATSSSDNATSGYVTADVTPQSARTASSLVDLTASSGAPEDVTRSTDPAEASAGQAVPTVLSSETVEGPAPTAEVVNPHVSVVSLSKHPSQRMSCSHIMRHKIFCDSVSFQENSNISRTVQTQTRLSAMMMLSVIQHP